MPCTAAVRRYMIIRPTVTAILQTVFLYYEARKSVAFCQVPAPLGRPGPRLPTQVPEPMLCEEQCRLTELLPQAFTVIFVALVCVATSGLQIASNETTPAIVAVFTEDHPERGHVARMPKACTHVRHRLLVLVNWHVLASCRSYNAQRCAYTLQEPLREFPQMTFAILRKFRHS